MKGLYSDLDNKVFLGKKIKLAFPAVNPVSGKQLLEFIKVQVSHHNINTTELIGLVLEESNFISEYKAGDIISFNKGEITEMCSEGIC